MSALTSETPVQRVHCEVSQCDKNYASKGGMLAHVKKNHKVADQISSPLGSFPHSRPARVLFGSEAEPAVQGTSVGEVTSPEVSSEGRFIRGNCGKNFGTQEEQNKHKK